MSDDSTPTPIGWVNSLQARLVLAEQDGRTSVQVNVEDFEILTDVEMQLLTLDAALEEMRAVRRALVRDNRDKTTIIRELEAALREIASVNNFEINGLWEEEPALNYVEMFDIARAALAAVSAEKEAEGPH